MFCTYTVYYVRAYHFNMFAHALMHYVYYFICTHISCVIDRPVYTIEPNNNDKRGSIYDFCRARVVPTAAAEENKNHR